MDEDMVTYYWRIIVVAKGTMNTEQSAATRPAVAAEKEKPSQGET